MPNKLRVIIGAGTAAQIFRQLTEVQGWDTVVLGSDGLWARVQQGIGAGHQMGQPPHLLHLPGQPVPAFQTADGAAQGGPQGFMTAGNFQATVAQLAGANAQRDGALLQGWRATRIERHQDLIRVTTNQPNDLLADQVVIASGIGPQREPPPAHGTPAAGLNYTQILEGVDYLCRQDPTGNDVFVYGGGATAAWVAHQASQNAQRLTWAARLGGSGFAGGILPGSRNHEILQQTEQAGTRIRATVIDLTYLPKLQIGNQVVRRPRVMVRMQTENGGERVCAVDQFLYALGGDARAPGSVAALLDDGLAGELEPLRDHDRVLSDGSGTLCWATADQRVLVVGAAAFNMATQHHPRQRAPMSHLPRNAQVPDGIAMITAAESALHHHVPITQDGAGRVASDRVNLNVGDRNQVAAWVAVHYPDISPAAANMAVDGIVGHRAATDFGLTQQEITTIIQNAVQLA